MNLMDKKEVQLILKQLKITPNKKLGQNFLIDKNIVNKIGSRRSCGTPCQRTIRLH